MKFCIKQVLRNVKVQTPEKPGAENVRNELLRLPSLTHEIDFFFKELVFRDSE